MGSFVMTSITSLHAPLLIIPPEAVYKTIDKIGLACDMVNVSETIPFEQIKEVLRSIKATLEVLYISSENENMYPNVLTQTKFMQTKSNYSGIQQGFTLLQLQMPKQHLSIYPGLPML